MRWAGSGSEPLRTPRPETGTGLSGQKGQFTTQSHQMIPQDVHWCFEGTGAQPASCPQTPRSLFGKVTASGSGGRDALSWQMGGSWAGQEMGQQAGTSIQARNGAHLGTPAPCTLQVMSGVPRAGPPETEGERLPGSCGHWLESSRQGQWRAW